MILDTNALSAFVDGDPALAMILTNASMLAIPSIVLGEYRFGILGSRYRMEYETWLNANLDGKTVLAITDSTSRHYAAIRAGLKAKGRPIPYHDIWIAALAREHGLPVVSRDIHFDAIDGLQRLHW